MDHRYHKRSETASPYAGDLKAIDEVKIIDDHMVQMELKYPFPNLLFNHLTQPQEYKRLVVMKNMENIMELRR